MLQCTTLTITFITQKVQLEIFFSFFLTFNKIELGIFCQKIKVFLQPFLSPDLKNPKIENAISGGKAIIEQ